MSKPDSKRVPLHRAAGSAFVAVSLAASLAAPAASAFAADQNARYSGNQVDRAVAQQQAQLTDITAL